MASTNGLELKRTNTTSVHGLSTYASYGPFANRPQGSSSKPSRNASGQEYYPAGRCQTLKSSHQNCVPTPLHLDKLPAKTDKPRLLDSIPPPAIPHPGPNGVKALSDSQKKNLSKQGSSSDEDDGNKTNTKQKFTRIKPHGLERDEKQLQERKRRYKMGEGLEERLDVSAKHYPNLQALVKAESAHMQVINMRSVQAYLRCHPDFLDAFMAEHVDSERLKSALQRQRTHMVIFKEPAEFSRYARSDLRSLAETCYKDVREFGFLPLLREVAQLVSMTLRVDKMTLYAPRVHNALELDWVTSSGARHFYCNVKTGKTVVAVCASSHHPLVVPSLHENPYFAEGAGPSGDHHICSVLAVPLVVPPDDYLVGVLEMIRFQKSPPFEDCDLQIADAAFAWPLTAIAYSNLSKDLALQLRLNERLLEDAKILANDTVSMDELQQTVMRLSKELLSAERVAFFMADNVHHDLKQEFQDDGLTDNLGRTCFTRVTKRYRLKKVVSIATRVLDTTQSYNAHNVLVDLFYNKDVDGFQGLRVRNVISVPAVLAATGEVLAILQLVNSTRSKDWGLMEEAAFRYLGVMTALAIDNIRKLIALRQQQDQFRVTLEMLHYHFVCSPLEYEHFRCNPFPSEYEMPSDFDTYALVLKDQGLISAKLMVYTMDKLFDLRTSGFDIDKVCRFILTMRKNYRSVLYHNWYHGFHVAHCIYMMLLTNQNFLSEFEGMALFVAAISHDVDHRGFNNAFMQKFNLPLGALYTTSVMEQHHYKHTVLILQTPGHDIFSFLPSEEYKVMLDLIKQHIMATDLATHFPNQKALSRILDDHKLDLKIAEHRMRVQHLMITAADLCAMCKPWTAHYSIVMDLYEEFYIQGDEEKKHGCIPIPIMDRDKKNEAPVQQMDFITVVCQPLYATLTHILPNTKPLLRGVERNYRQWLAFHEAYLRQTAPSMEGDAVIPVEYTN